MIGTVRSYDCDAVAILVIRVKLETYSFYTVETALLF